MNEGAPAPFPNARTAWLAYAAVAIIGALTVLTIYVNTYDDYDVSECLYAAGAFTRRAMSALSFPLGFLLSTVAGGPLEASFNCGATNEPCAIFIDWNLKFAAIISQIALLRGIVTRRR